MNFSETEFILFLLSLFLVHRVISLLPDNRKNFFVFVWMTQTVFLFSLFEVLRFFQIPIPLANTYLSVLSQTNVIFFVTYISLEKISSNLTARPNIFLFLCLGLVLSYFPNIIGMLTNSFGIQVFDKTGITHFFIFMGTFTWLSQMFFIVPGFSEPEVDPRENSPLYFLLPISFLIFSPWTEDPKIWSYSAQFLLIGFFSFLGFKSTSYFLKVPVEREIEKSVWVGVVSFASCAGLSFFLYAPVTILVGVFARLMEHLLSKHEWSKTSTMNFCIYFFPSVLATYFPLLLLPRIEWPHAPYVLLGVQTLYFLTIHLTAAFIFGLFLLGNPKPKAEFAKKQ
ncbi:hypothetical protein P3G55_14505 [Leptospira sp. 96542]|nr:hypothetical protein [Leptospira sp. 96542]